MSEQIQREKPIPEFKKKIVGDFKEMMENNRTVLVASCKGLPGQQFHDIKKKLRGKAEIKFARKSAINRAIDETGKGALNNLKENMDSDFAMVFSDMDPFELSGLLTENESPSRAKAGDTSPEDIEIEPGPTELVAGPAISELQGVGLKVKVTDGKLEIIKGAVVVKEGEEINENVAGVLGKLDITPMKVGFIPLAAYDSKEDKVYTGIVIDKLGTLEEMKNLIGKALSFAINKEYTTKETISYFISKASSEEKALANLAPAEKTEESKKEVEEEENEEKSTSENEESNLTENIKEEQK